MMPESWTVARLWWELTKMVLSGRGGYEAGAVVEEVADAAALDGIHLGVTECHWVGGEDRYATLVIEPTVSDG